MTNRPPLTANELKAVAYFAVGVTSEGSIAGRDVSYRLSFAGNVGPGGRMQPVANSGYSFGTLQIDLGQHPEVAWDLLDRYQAWAARQPDRARLELGHDEYDGVLASLQRTGRRMRADNAVDIDRSGLNRFMASDEGQAFVHGLDSVHVEGVTAVDAFPGNRDSALERLQRTQLYRDAVGSEQAELAGMFMKLQNQAGRGRWPGLLERVEAGTLASSEAVRTAIDGLLPNQPNGDPDYLQSGAGNTLRGVGLVNALRDAHADNRLARAWANVVADPMVGPVGARRPDAVNPDMGFEYDAVRSLFLTPEASRRLIAALDQGASLAEGDPRRQANGSRHAGFYVSGNDFVHWNRNGQGLAFVEGQWLRIDPDALTRIRTREGITELRIDEGGRSRTLLSVDPRTPALRPDAAAHEDRSRDAWNEADRVFAATLRDRIGPAYGDEQVMAIVQRAREAGFKTPQAIELSCVQDSTFFMRGDHTTGYAFVRVGIDEDVSAQVEPLAAIHVANPPREQAHEAALESPRIRLGAGLG
ncbi:hypothetical protein [Luteimonas sp. MC1895]|uniref:hypothetical protein n=1 Tax=Luteimonas sp. MC1895 TaxID=2819513 RepID=UPI0018F0CB38|nr:hypothetical protein [Luteimonas sp. MC1895]MBJ6979423.1 hypothetical protein [Luteimonas sp. MC1895]